MKNYFRVTIPLLLIVWLSFSLPGYAQDIDIAIVGGTSFGYPPDFGKDLVEIDRTFTVTTEVGESPPIYQMNYSGTSFYYVQMHGVENRPLEEPDGWHFVRTWAALYKLGVKFAFGGATNGGIDPAYEIGDMIVAHDMILLNSHRPQNILRASGISRPGIFPNFEQPFSVELRKLLIDIANTKYPGRVYESGVFIQDDPGRFETPAEIRMMRIMGADHVSHNVGTEATYARQLGIHFAVLNSISNPANGVRPYEYEDMQNGVQKIAAYAVPIVLEAVLRIDEIRDEIDPDSAGKSYEGTYTNPKTGGKEKE